MQNILKRIGSLSVAAILCLSISLAVQGAVSDFAVADAVGYYSDITATGGDELLGQVHDLITTTHKKYTTYNDCKNISLVTRTDKGEAKDTVMEFYTQEDISSEWDGNNAGTWNREHVWCQSLTKQPLSNNLWGTNGGGSDLHHIRPSEVRLNGTRGNRTFGETNGGAAAYYIDKSGNNKYVGGYVSGNTFEPLDKVKGDVARIVMYLYAHYNNYTNVHGSTNGGGESWYFGTLNFTQIMSLSKESDAIDLLLQWNEADPVDQTEIQRNNAVYEIQGNRNPFIDHPEYADAIWGDSPLQSDENVKAFHNTVAAITSDGSLSARRSAINKAITAYKNLTDTEKESAESDVAALYAAIEEYNSAIEEYNSAAQDAERAAWSGIGSLFNTSD